MSVTLSPVSSLDSPVRSAYSPFNPLLSTVSSVYNSAYSPVSTIYSASTDSFPYIPTSLPIDYNNRDVVITSDYPLIFNKDRDNLAISPLYPYAYPNRYPYTNPSVVIPYENLNKNPDVVNRLTKYFYYKTLDKWLYEELSGLQRYLKMSNGKINVIKNESDKDKENISQEEADKKVKFIEDELFSKDDMYDILMKIQQETDIELIKMSKQEFIVQGYVKKFLKREFQKMMGK